MIETEDTEFNERYCGDREDGSNVKSLVALAFKLRMDLLISQPSPVPLKEVVSNLQAQAQRLLSRILTQLSAGYLFDEFRNSPQMMVTAKP